MTDRDKEKLILKGSVYGATVFHEYKNPDIIRSHLAITDPKKRSTENKWCTMNRLTVNYKGDNTYYLYHSYDEVDNNKRAYSGRWYNGGYLFSEKDLNLTENTFTVLLKSVEWEDDATGGSAIKNVEITIYLSNSGFRKLERYFNRDYTGFNN